MGSQQHSSVLDLMNTAEGLTEELYEEYETHVNWLRDVVDTARTLKSGGNKKRAGDLLPKTPKKAKKNRTAKVLTDDVEVLSASVNDRVEIKRCSVQLEDIDTSKSSKAAINRALTNIHFNSENKSKTLECPREDSTDSEPLHNPPIKPSKPPRKLNAKGNKSKENKSPKKKNVVPDGFVATQVKEYEEKHGLSPLKKAQLILEDVAAKASAINNNIIDPRRTTVVSLNNIDDSDMDEIPDEAIEAKITEIQISRMSISQRRSSRMRCKLNYSKNVLRKLSAQYDEKLARKSMAASNTQSPSFITAQNSPVLNNNSSENEIVDETQDGDINKDMADGALLANNGIDNDSSQESCKTPQSATRCSPRGLTSSVKESEKVGGNTGTLTKDRELSAKESATKESEIMTSSKTNVPVSGFPKKSSIIFGIKRNMSASPTGSLYRFGSTPDRMMTPQNDTMRYERMALLDARAESVLKKREEFLKQRVAEQTRKREARLKKVAEVKQLREKEREKKIKKLKEDEKLLLIKKKLREEQKRQAEAELLRELKEQKLREERERQEAEIKKALAAQALAQKAKQAESAIPVKPQVKAITKLATVSPALDATFNANEAHNASYNADSYEMTPKNRPTVLINPENYDIDNLKEEDSSDDEENPKKPIPVWAQGEALRSAVLKQQGDVLKFIRVFQCDQFMIPNLNEVFKTRRKRFNHRTSSAVWTKPILPSLNS